MRGYGGTGRNVTDCGATNAASVQTDDGGWSVEWDDENFVARSPHSIADSVPAKWVGVVTMRSFKSGVYPSDLTEEDKEYIKAAMRPKAVRRRAYAPR